MKGIKYRILDTVSKIRCFEMIVKVGKIIKMFDIEIFISRTFKNY